MSRIYRFFVRNPATSKTLATEKSFSLLEKAEPEIVFQLTKVLRIKTGDTIVLLPNSDSENFLLNDCFEYSYQVLEIHKNVIELSFETKKANDNELPFHLNLFLCVPNKPDKLELILQKAVELGVTNIFLLESDFSQMKHQLRLDRLQKIVIEAAEQSERAFIPTLSQTAKLKFYLEHEIASRVIWVAMERIALKDHSLSDLLKNKDFKQSVNILIGPEGGFSEDEKKIISEKQISCFSLGKRILRMETAAILSLGIVSSFE